MKYNHFCKAEQIKLVLKMFKNYILDKTSSTCKDEAPEVLNSVIDFTSLLERLFEDYFNDEEKALDATNDKGKQEKK